MSANLTTRDNPQRSRYEALREAQVVGEIRYETQPGSIVLVHTEIDPSERGTGSGSHLVRAALDDIRTRGLDVVPLCPFVAAYIRRHSEYADLVAKAAD